MSQLAQDGPKTTLNWLEKQGQGVKMGRTSESSSGRDVAGSRHTVAMASPCSGRMKLDSSVSTALTSHRASTAKPHTSMIHTSYKPCLCHALHAIWTFGNYVQACNEKRGMWTTKIQNVFLQDAKMCCSFYTSMPPG